MKLVQYSWKTWNGHWAFWHGSFHICNEAYRVWSERLCWSRICNELRPVPPEELKWKQPEYNHIERKTKFMVKGGSLTTKYHRILSKSELTIHVVVRALSYSNEGHRCSRMWCLPNVLCIWTPDFRLRYCCTNWNVKCSHFVPTISYFSYAHLSTFMKM